MYMCSQAIPISHVLPSCNFILFWLLVQVFALGFCSVFDQVLEGVPSDRAEIFNAYVKALDEDPEKYRTDASNLEKWASGISNPEDLHPSSEGDDIRKRLAEIAQNAKDGKFLYTRFFAIGLFRLLELSKAKDPAALQALVKAMNIEQDAVNRDLMTYKVCHWLIIFCASSPHSFLSRTLLCMCDDACMIGVHMLKHLSSHDSMHLCTASDLVWLHLQTWPLAHFESDPFHAATA